MYYNDTIDDGIYIVDVSGVAPRNEAMALKGIILRMVFSSTIWKLEFWHPAAIKLASFFPVCFLQLLMKLIRSSSGLLNVDTLAPKDLHSLPFLHLEGSHPASAVLHELLDPYPCQTLRLSATKIIFITSSIIH